MSLSKFQNFLKSTAGDEEIEFVIPHPFLPPRYLVDSERRNLIVLLDRDLTIHLKWENSRMATWANITKGEFRRLARESLHKMAQYRTDLKVFAKFVDKVAEAPFEDPIYDEPLQEEHLAAGIVSEEGSAEEVMIYSKPRVEEGGEPPLLTTEW